MSKNDQNKKDVLNAIGDYVKGKCSKEIEFPWNPGSYADGTIGFTRYKNFSINVRLRKYAFKGVDQIGASQIRGSRKVVDIHVYTRTDLSSELMNKITAKETDFKNASCDVSLCQWIGTPGVLVKYLIPVNWEDWQKVGEDVRSQIVSVYEAVVRVISGLGNAVHGGTVGEQRGVARKARKKTNDLFDSLNLIVFGAPGTGKSREIDECRTKTYAAVQKLDCDPARAGETYFAGYERVTFYPTYSYAQFVGSYKPYMAEVGKDGFEPEGEEKRRKVIAYKFVPGPFLRILTESLKEGNGDKNYLLIIEEINRANAAAVFGDMFQLLDRKTDDDDEEVEGDSEYAITPSEEVKEWLREQGVDEEELRIPGNLYIWATMNSADQGVFPLDTAFKRRWDFKYLSLEDKKDNDKVFVECGKEGCCQWGELRKAINNLLARNHVNEDKHLSSYFVKPDGDKIISHERFKMKVLMYLWEDAARMCRTQIFNKDILTFSKLMKAWNDVRLSKLGENEKPLDGDNPLESIFCFGTSEIVKVEKVETNGGTDVDPAKGGNQGQDGAADNQQEKNTEQAVGSVDPVPAVGEQKDEQKVHEQAAESANQPPAAVEQNEEENGQPNPPVEVTQANGEQS